MQKISVTTAGDPQGIPVLLIHGAWGTCFSHMESLIKPLVDTGHYVICPDLTGYGKSQPATRVFTVKPGERSYFHRDASDLAALLRHLTPKTPAIVMGFSDGGEVGLIMTALYPELVRGSLLWGTSGQITRELIDSFVATIPASLQDPIWNVAGDEGWKDWKDILVARHGQKAFRSAISSYSPAIYQIYKNGGWLLTDQEMRSVKRPIFLAYGVKDSYNPEAEIQKLAQKIGTYQTQTTGGVPMVHSWATLHKMQEVGHTAQKEEKGLLMLLSSLRQLVLQTTP